MEIAFAGLAAAGLATGFYLLLSGSLVRRALGVAALAAALNLLVLAAGRALSGIAPGGGAGDPLPQAIAVLVVLLGLALLAVLLALLHRAGGESESGREGGDVPRPPLGY